MRKQIAAARTLRGGRLQSITASAAGLLLVGAAAAPAQAESAREKQWHLGAMKAEQMWQTSKGKGVTVAVVDTGVDSDSPDLEGKVLEGKNFAPSSRAGDEHTDYDGHGTAMAGLIAGSGEYGGGDGAFGLAPGVRILPVRMPDTKDISPFEVPSYFSKGIRYAADSGARIINVSMGGGMDSAELSEAVKYALGKGALVFAGAGNDAEKKQGGEVEYPAATPGVVGVAAVGKNLRRTSWSQRGPHVDIAAPGDEIYALCRDGKGVCNSDGTSSATALASAGAALIWSKHPDWTNNQVLRVMLNTIGAPTDGAKRNDSIGYGIVRPRVALQNPGDPGPADEYPLPDLEQATSKSPAPSQSRAATPDHDRTSAAAPETTEGDGGGTGATTWIVTGVGAAALIGGAVAALAVRKRRAAGHVHVTGRQ